MSEAGAALYCLESKPFFFARSWSRLQDLGRLELEPPKKVAALQHWEEDDDDDDDDEGENQ